MFPTCAFENKDWDAAYRQVCKETEIVHHLTETLPKVFAAVHIRGGDKADPSAEFLKRTPEVIREIADALPIRRWRVITDDVSLWAKLRSALSDRPALLEALVLVEPKTGLDATIRDLAVLTHASLIIQHSPSGWSAFSHLASLLREIPIINTF